MKINTYAHFLLHALRLKIDPRHRAPLTMNIQLTHRCDNHCLYCDYDRGGSEELGMDALAEIFQEAWNIGGRRINFTGGEPLLRPDLVKIIQSAKKIGFLVGVSTKRGAGQIDALKLCDWVMLSFDGPFEVRKFLCGEKSALETEEAVELFKKHSINFWTTTVLTTASIPHIDWIVDHASKTGGLANFVLLHTQPWEGIRFHPKAARVRDITPTQKQIQEVIRRLIVLKKSGAPIGSSMPYLKEWLDWPDYSNICSPARSPVYKCLAGRAFCELMASGDLYSCGWMRGKLPGVSVLDQGFANAFNKLPKIEGCNSCASSCWLESNLIFNLNPRTVTNWIKFLIKG